MADPFSVVASALTVGTAAAQLSLALFSVAHTVKFAKEEISDIAEEISTLSGSLLVLGDLLEWHQKLCKAELFTQVHSIFARYQHVEAELRKLIEPRKSFKRRLKWFFDAPKAKALLQRIETIKNSLNLVLNIIRLSVEEVERGGVSTNPGRIQHQYALPPSNRYRKVVESVVQANRLAVERAQKENQENPTEKRRHYDSALQRWQADSDDTATWLYHLVFMSGVQSAPLKSVRYNLQGPYTATVEDYESENSERPAKTEQTVDIPRSISGKTEHTVEVPRSSNQVIVWDNTTEPSSVVDRLLYSWTFLSDTQIQTSRIPAPPREEDAWREALLNKIKNYTDEKDTIDAALPHNDLYDMASSSENDYPTMPKGPGYHHPSSTRRRRPRPLSEESLDDSDDAGGISLVDVPVKAKSDEWGYNPFEPLAGTGSRPHQQQRSRDPMLAYPPHSAYAPPPHHASFPVYEPQLAPVPPVPPVPQHPIPVYEPYSAPAPPPPTYAPPPPSTRTSEDGSSYAKLGSLLAEMVRKEEKSVTDKRMSDLETRLFSQMQAKQEGGPPQVDVLQLIAALKDKGSDEPVAKLERLLLEQKQDNDRRQREAEATWRAEKAESEAKAVKAALESEKLLEREIKAAKAAKKAAEKALKFAKEQAAERVRQEADAKAAEQRKTIEAQAAEERRVIEAKAAEERRIMDEDYKKRIAAYEERLAAFTKDWQESNDLRNSNSTFEPSVAMSDAQRDRKIEVRGLNDRGHILNQTGAYFGNVIQRPHHKKSSRQSVVGNGKSPNQRTPLQATGISSRTFPSHDTRIGAYSDQARSLILLPSRGSASTQTSELRAQLSGNGLLVPVDELSLEKEDHDLYLDLEAKESQLVCSTIFWEPPILPLGSELLSTLRLRGWRPLYFRMSDSGQTYFMGNQPIHVNFFKPDYNPQFTASTKSCETEWLIITDDLVEEYALVELGFQFQYTNTGAYALDARLTANDVDALVDRSFMLRENNFRRLHRQLQWTPTINEGYALSTASDASTATSVTAEYATSDSVPGSKSVTSHTGDDFKTVDSSFVSAAVDLGLYMQENVTETSVEVVSGISTGSDKRSDLHVRFRSQKSKEHVD